MKFTFTEQQSNAIASVAFNEQDVLIAFRSNPNIEYSFVTEYEDQLISYCQNPTGSIGQTYHSWVNTKMLIPVEQLAAV